MVNVVLKPDPDPSVDLYVVWSDNVEAPIAWGSHDEMLTWLTDEFDRRFPNEALNEVSDPAHRLARAAANGTSAAGGFEFFGRWDDEYLIYEQRGFLPRAKLADAVAALEADRPDLVWDMLEPLEEGMEVRRG